MEREKTHSIFFSLSPLLYLILSILFFRFIWQIPYPHPMALFVAGFLSFLQRRDRKLLFLKSAFRKNFLSVLPAMEILFFVGMLIASWAYAGVLLVMIQAGILFLQPDYFLPSLAIVAAIAAMVSGSSWTTAGTLGVALMGVAEVISFPPSMAAGAIVSGCYFGDKLSPLSDTTNLASSLTHVPIWSHIRHMLKTTCISFAIAIFCFYILNLFVWDLNQFQNSTLQSNQFLLDTTKQISWLKFIPVVLVFGSALLKIHIRISLALGIVSAIAFSVKEFGLPFDIIKTLVYGFESHSGNVVLDRFLSGGGVVAILPTEILILAAVWFGAVVEGYGYLAEILIQIKNWANDRWDILLSTMGTSFLLNMVTADQYLSLVVPARAFRSLAEEKGIPEKDISRALEDSGTITSPLIPWNSCGAFMSTSLGVSVISFLPFVFFNLIHIILSVSVLLIGKKNIKVHS
ncbi:sodium:proton antiporter [Leptospira sp. 2 VSF19]|uniref:Sodium:proton antiporter n=1 Tax=Leptospira soteropolitanensis TaxID=2950025 RepID=A0AAW5VEV4_9LEPT|nr:Na+/H+ antiporter NhaC family protein [Leptospira soteropolitanensis]MCW7493977.1 sodium:proton antiporter [Leptospira soteropolitanensis]MCW7501571.1 sodium:proton antiporter [Leptospira soteropolitanensis]MCW7523667.1 sodium:proton antiporter [Leptospira soteropolitanensis]MCW7527530.1 sodium:proton antiporter [Leptospira soteropolitanensis]MCW7531384.1 sodium:proton antiporter [Leptospira soteropolitanensis]